MTHKTPCQASATPEDWFLESDGKQYPDDPLLTEAQRKAVTEAVREAAEPEEFQDTLRKAILQAEGAAKHAALTRRRHAKDACFTDCYFRLQCLGLALEGDPVPAFGIWGGYDRDERAEIVKVRNERRAAAIRRGSLLDG